MKNKRKLVKSYWVHVKYLVKLDNMGEVLVDRFTEQDFNYLKGNGVIDILEVKKVKRLLIQ